MHPLTISAKDQNLLSVFPLPPPGLPSPSKSLPLSPSPVRAADFGFIPVGSRDDDSDSLYDSPEEPYYGDTESRSKPTAAINSGEFQLVLDHPSRVFAPNDVVTGYILGWEPSSPHISITLQGRVETWMRRDKTEYRACTPLLHHVTQLTLDQSNSIPQFSITIPTRVTTGLSQRNEYAPTASNNPWTHNWPSQPPFEHEPNHPLPPSLTTPHLTSTTLATSYAEAFCRISYTLAATRSSSSPSPSSVITAAPTIPLTLSTLHLPPSKLRLLRSQFQTLSTDLSIRTLHLLKPPPLPNPSTAPKHPTPKLSLRSAFLDAFTTSSPAFHFRAFVSLPQVVTPGADLPLTIRLEVLSPPPGESYTFAVPDVHIKRGRVRVVAWTGVRCAPPPPSPSLHAPSSGARLGRRALSSCLKDKNVKPSPPSSHTPPSHTFKHTILRTSFALPSSPSSSSHTFTPLDGAFAHQKCVITNVTFPSENAGKDDDGAAPCFTTWTAWRSYEVKVEVVFEVVGREVCGRWRAGVDVVRGDV